MLVFTIDFLDHQRDRTIRLLPVVVGFLVGRADELDELADVDIAGGRVPGFGQLLRDELVHGRYAAYFGIIVAVIV